MAEDPAPGGAADVKKTGENGEALRIGTGLPGPGRPRGVPNRHTAEMKARVAEFLSSGPYWDRVKVRIAAGVAAGLEIELWHYAYGKPKETVKLEGEGRPPVQIVFLGASGDPLSEPEPAPQGKTRPALPPALPEVGFEVADLDLPPPERS